NFGDVPVLGYELKLERVAFDRNGFRVYIVNTRPKPLFPAPPKVVNRVAFAVELGALPPGDYHFEVYVTDKRWGKKPETAKQWEKNVRSAAPAKGRAKS
ncbi:MAG TPA: hypothetical protein VMY37_21715, partial [Thermoguttaceae bacterium]|nr:hypothetical protein [Thermoguttaceae bacterium]